MPYRSNGKIDTEKLLLYKKDTKNLDSIELEDNPRTTIEVDILNFWRDVFENPDIGMEDDFFDLGGHSILAMRIVNQINNKYSILLPVTAIMQNSTARRLAIRVETETKTMWNDEIYITEPSGVYPVTTAQQRMYIMESINKMQGGYNMPQAFIVNGPLNTKLLKDALMKVIQRHDILRSTFEIKKGKLCQIVHTDVQLPFSIHQPIREEEIEHFIQNAIQPFHFTEPPLMRFILAPIIGQGTLFFFDMHHIISDGVSLGLIVQELATFYNGNNLPSISLQYHDYTQWHQRHITDARFIKQQSFWQEVFRSELPSLDLPQDLSVKSSKEKTKGNTVFFQVDEKDSRQIKTFLRDQGVTMFMFFMSVYHAMLHRLTGSEDITV
ncbi:condensation domain-containing protein, partial [Streptomyces koyangensis]